MKKSNAINAYYIDEQGSKQKIKANEIFIDLPYGQTLQYSGQFLKTLNMQYSGYN